ncbi:guanylate kinase [Candidatus Hydrogenedentota bacterium]
MTQTGLMVIISGPSGVGKTTLCDKLMALDGNLKRSISATTRQPRPGEKNGEDYYFVGRDEFRRMIDEDNLAEWAEVFGELYGTPKKGMAEIVATGNDCLLAIDVQGGMKLSKEHPEALSIFVLPPDMAVLRIRLGGRNKDHDDEIMKRLEKAEWECGFKDQYDCTVINGDLEEAVREIREIMAAEREASRNSG